MNDILFYNGQILGEKGILESGYAVVKGGEITEVGDGDGAKISTTVRLDLNGRYLSPGFIDMHTHGGGGSDFMDGTAESFLTACVCI